MSPLERMMLDMLGRADADPYFDDIGLFILRPRYSESGQSDDQQSFAVIQTRIDQLIAGESRKSGHYGAAVTFLMPEGDTTKPNPSGPQMEFVFTARIQEMPIINFGPNGTRKSAEEIALYIVQLFHLAMFNGGNSLYADVATLTPSTDYAPKVTYDVRFRMQGNLRAPVKCAMAIITPNSGASPQTVTLTSATGGAAIYYTIDGSYPSSRGKTAQLYSGPITVAFACTLRAAAELAGSQQSSVSQGIYT